MADVEREQLSRRPFLSFSAGLEDLFQRALIDEYSNSMFFNWLVGFVLFNSFLSADYLVLNESFKCSLAYHMFVYTPLWSLAFVVLQNVKLEHRHACLFLASLIPIGTELLILLNQSGFNRLYFMSGLAAAPMCVYIVLRPRLPWAILSVIVQGCAYVAVLASTDIVGEGGKLVTALFFLSGTAITVMTAYSLEAACRRSFLLSLRVRILNREFERMAMTDPLMGLGNRRLLDETTSRYWTRSANTTQLASMIMIDVDHFKAFNDHHGHSAGDRCLVMIGRCVASLMRDGQDIAVRYGGEEIAVFLPDTGFAYARTIAEQIRLAIEDAAVPHPTIAQTAIVSASFGVATVRVSASTPAELAVDADHALYSAKRNGRNQVWPQMQADLSDLPPAHLASAPDGPDVMLRRAS